LVARWSLAIPANPDLHLLSPYRETSERIRPLAAHDALRPRLVGTKLTQAAALSLPPNSKDAGYLDQVAFDLPDRLLVQGWAQILSHNQPRIVSSWDTEMNSVIGN
jgi:hypothetical protein